MSYQTTAEVAYEVEKCVRYALHMKRLVVTQEPDPENIGLFNTMRELYTGEGYTVTVFTLYSTVQERARIDGYIVTAQFFNHVLADMKKAGIVGTAKGGEVAFLTEAAFEQDERERLQRVAARKVKS
jgi:hypothetical protein